MGIEERTGAEGHNRGGHSWGWVTNASGPTGPAGGRVLLEEEAGSSQKARLGRLGFSWAEWRPEKHIKLGSL